MCTGSWPGAGVTRLANKRFNMKKLLLAFGLAKLSELTDMEIGRDYYAHRVAEWQAAAEQLSRTNRELSAEKIELEKKIESKAAAIAGIDNELDCQRQEFRRVSLQLAAKCDEAAQLRRDLDAERSKSQFGLPLLDVAEPPKAAPVKHEPMITVRKYLARNAGIDKPSRGLLIKVSKRASKIAKARGVEIGKQRNSHGNLEQNCCTYPAPVIADAYRSTI